VLIAVSAAPGYGATPASVTGVVRDAAGTPQIGAFVQLLRPDLSVVASVYTNAKGRFDIASVIPGRYALKAMGTSYLPSLREDVRVRSTTVVNLTLNTLYEVMQWLPAEPRAGNSQQDDWAWTLRSAANRPLLRWLEDGPLVVVSDGSGAVPRLKARLMATGQEGTFGESGERFSAAVEDTPSDSRELLARVDFSPDTNAGMESMLGFRQDLGYAGSVQSMAAMSVHPDMEDAGGQGLDEAAMRTWESMQMGDEFEAEAGSNQVVARFAANSPNTVIAALPFAQAGWRNGATTLQYRMSTFLPGQQQGSNEAEAQAWLPRVSTRGGGLLLEHGMHQEIGWERRTDASGMQVLFFADRIDNPAVEAMTHLTNGGSGADSVAASALLDRVSGILRTAGPDFSSAGMLASFERNLPGRNHIKLSYANGNALVVEAAPQAPGLAQLMAATHARRAQTYSISLSGTLDGTGTKWRASYRWQPEDTLTQVAPYALDASAPFFNVHVRQPIRLRTEGATSVEALIDMQNLLAEGYQPFVLSDGSVLVFAQDQRSVRAGLAFTF